VSKSVKIVLSVEVEVDHEYSGEQHAKDILLTTRKTFPAAKVKPLMIEIGRETLEPA